MSRASVGEHLMKLLTFQSETRSTKIELSQLVLTYSPLSFAYTTTLCKNYELNGMDVKRWRRYVTSLYLLLVVHSICMYVLCTMLSSKIVSWF